MSTLAVQTINTRKIIKNNSNNNRLCNTVTFQELRELKEKLIECTNA